MSKCKSTTPSAERKSENPAKWLGPDDTLMAGGYDFAWCYVVFKEIEGFPAYRVGSNGTVWTKRRGHEHTQHLRPWKQLTPVLRAGYSRIRLYDGSGSWTSKSIHHLVLEAFVGPRPEGTEGCHFPDNTRSNNNLWNLRWDTHLANSQDASKIYHARGIKRAAIQSQGDKSNFSKLTSEQVLVIRQLAFDGAKNRELAKRFGLYETHVSRILNGYSWSHLDPEGLARLKAKRYEPHRKSKPLTEEQVLDIWYKLREGVGIQQLCEQFEVGAWVVNRIRRAKGWKHILPPKDFAASNSRMSA